MTKYFIQTRSKTKTVTGDWFDFLGPYNEEQKAINNIYLLTDAHNHQFRVIKRVDYIIEIGDIQ